MADFQRRAAGHVMDVAGHRGGARSLFAAVFEDAGAFEACLVDEREQLVVVGFRLAGKSDDECRAQRDARDAGADSADQVADVRRRRFRASSARASGR